MDQLERWARGVGCGMVTVRSNLIREGAHAFYQRLGFEVIKTQRVLRKPIGAGRHPNLDLNEG
jgi:GNAT superfamily N-acetyltransferase